MKINLVLQTDDPKMIDVTDGTGLSREAYDALIESLMELGYELADGPDKVVD